MSVKIHRESSDNSIAVRYLKRGQIAEITQWDSDSAQIGTIIQSCAGGKLEIVGEANHWPDPPQQDECRVRILPNGTLIEVNQ